MPPALTKGLNSPDFVPKEDVEDYLHNDFNSFLYAEYTEKVPPFCKLSNPDDGFFQSYNALDLLNLVYEQIALIKNNLHKPLSLVKYLTSKELYTCNEWINDDKIGTTEDVLDWICVILRNRIGLSDFLAANPDNGRSLQRLYNLIKAETEKRIFYAFEDKFDEFNEDGAYIENKNNPDNFDDDTIYPVFHALLASGALNAHKIKSILSGQMVSIGSEYNTTSAPTQEASGPQFKLATNKRGAKTDLIRVLNSLYELRYIETPCGQIPNKAAFMKKAGALFGVDLTRYEADLSQSLNNVSLEANLKVFRDMEKIIKNYILRSE